MAERSIAFYWTQVMVLSECGFVSRPGRSRRCVLALSKTLNHNCFVLRMGHKAVGPVFYREREGACPCVLGFAALSTQQGGYVHATNLMLSVLSLYGVIDLAMKQ